MELKCDMRGLTLEGDERVDRLREGRWIIQRARGHKATTDDQLLAWAACDELERRAQHRAHEARAPLTVLELGAGKGTVTLWLSALLDEALFFGVEAFEESYQLSLKNRTLNKLEGRFFPALGDLRELDSVRRALSQRAALISELARADHSSAGFELVLGAPPFMPLGSGVMPRDPQRAAGRFEQRGGVEVYMRAVQASLSHEGFAVILMDGAGECRARSAAEREGLLISRSLRVTPRPHSPPTYSILWLRQATEVNAQVSHLDQPASLSMRDEEGEAWSLEYQVARRLLGL